MTRVNGARNVGPITQPLPVIAPAARVAREPVEGASTAAEEPPPVPQTPPTDLDVLSPVQRAAVVATAVLMLRDEEELAFELAPLLVDRPTDPAIAPLVDPADCPDPHETQTVILKIESERTDQ